jgi:hypothetical protein
MHYQTYRASPHASSKGHHAPSNIKVIDSRLKIISRFHQGKTLLGQRTRARPHLVWKYTLLTRRTSSYFGYRLTTGGSRSSSVKKLLECSYFSSKPQGKGRPYCSASRSHLSSRLNGKHSPTEKMSPRFQAISGSSRVNSAPPKRSLSVQSRQA